MKIKNLVARLFVLAAISLTSACSYQAAAVQTVAPTGEIRADKVRDAHAGYVFSVDDAELSAEARKTSYTCSAHTYPVDIGPALKGSLEAVMGASFTSHEELADINAKVIGHHDYVFVFDLEEPDFSMGMATGFWEGSANARTSITMKTVTYGTDGNEILRTNINGDGGGDSKGGCDAGAEALSQSATDAISELLENFIYKVINSDQI